MKILPDSKFYKKRGFTLIELLVVISIISLLSSIILTAVKDAKDRALQAAYREYLGEIVTAVELARSDFGNVDFLPQTNGNLFINLMDPGQSLSKYITWKGNPSFVINFYSRVRNSVEGFNYSCENDDSDYIIIFESKRSDLKFRKLFATNNTWHTSGFSPNLTYYYCVSPGRR